MNGIDFKTELKTEKLYRPNMTKEEAIAEAKALNKAAREQEQIEQIEEIEQND